jgi:glycosyltransferase involved in cell wall biosynthesis
MDAGSAVALADYAPRLEELIERADIVQFEYWDHPSLAALLAQDLPPMRAVFWQHKRTMPKPPGRVVYTSALSGEPYINSGFGFDQPVRTRGGNNIAYLGTANLSKMSPVFFDVMDRVNARAFVYGHASEEVEARVREMNNPYRVKLAGHTTDPQGALRGSGIFFYPLIADHYGTGENALCEAMSVGLVPVVLNNEVERGIVGDAGIICQDADSCVSAIVRLMSDENLMRNMSERAIERARAFSPEHSAAQFMELWGSMMAEPPQVLPVVPIVRPDDRPSGSGPSPKPLPAHPMPSPHREQRARSRHSA